MGATPPKAPALKAQDNTSINVAVSGLNTNVILPTRGAISFSSSSPFSAQRALDRGETGSVAARPREARDKAATDRIGNQQKNDRDGTSVLQHHRSSGCAARRE